MRILITGGAGFVGFNLLSYLKSKYVNFELIAIDNLQRRGSEINLKKIAELNIKFLHIDLKNKEEIGKINKVDLIIHCASDSSVLSGITDSSSQLLSTNLYASINLFEIASKWNAKLIFFSSNRVYPTKSLSQIRYKVLNNRFELEKNQLIKGVTSEGINEDFTLEGSKTFYGASKYCCELLLKEYNEYKNLNFIINRFGVISGTGQLGKISQGVISFWLKSILLNKELKYIGYGGQGHQVRDALHIDDLCEIVDRQINNFDDYSSNTFNIGGGAINSFSLSELTKICEDISGKKANIHSLIDNRPGDIPIYFTDNKKIESISDWKPTKGIERIVKDLFNWYQNESEFLNHN